MTATVLGFLALLVLIILAAYFAACETALMRVSRIRVRYLVEKKAKKADKLEKLIEKPDFFYPTVLLLGLAVQLTTASNSCRSSKPKQHLLHIREVKLRNILNWAGIIPIRSTPPR